MSEQEHVVVKKVIVGQLQTNCYILYRQEREDAVVVDPGADADAIFSALGARRVAAVLLTHGHFDHTGALAAVGEGADIVLHEADAPMLADAALSAGLWMNDTAPRPRATRFCREGDCLEYAGLSVHVLETPGHTPGGVCFRVGDMLLTGDTLFRAGYGRTDLPGGDMNALKRSLKRLLSMKDDCRVCPGHDDETTIALEAERMA